MTGKVHQGPWTGPPVQQPKRRSSRGWWERDDNELLHVCCGDGKWYPSPVPELQVKGPGNAIPKRSPNRDRITAALDMRGMYGPEVDEALGVTTPTDTTVDAWEAGDLVPSESEIRRLAMLTGMIPAWFYNGTLPVIEGFSCCNI